MGYYGFFFRKFAYANPPVKTDFQPPVSILISCKNEADHLDQLIPVLLAQDYPNFELVLINDHSTDATAEIIQKFAQADTRIKSVNIPTTPISKGNKKQALAYGISLASHEYLLFTDADCKPVTSHWISEMTQAFLPNQSIVLGYGTYEKRPTFLNDLIRYETLLTAWQYFSYAMRGLPYMGVGRNLAYTQTLFKNNKGFEAHQHILSGDDDLMVSQNANATQVASVWQQPAHTVSVPKTTWTAWFRQKRRHITTSHHYKPLIKLLLGLFYLTQIGFYTLFLTVLFFQPFSFLIIFIVLLRFIAYYYTLIPVARKLNETDLVWKAPLLECLLILMQGIIFISNLIRKPKYW